MLLLLMVLFGVLVISLIVMTIRIKQFKDSKVDKYDVTFEYHIFNATGLVKVFGTGLVLTITLLLIGMYYNTTGISFDELYNVVLVYGLLIILSAFVISVIVHNIMVRVDDINLYLKLNKVLEVCVLILTCMFIIQFILIVVYPFRGYLNII